MEENFWSPNLIFVGIHLRALPAKKATGGVRVDTHTHSSFADQSYEVRVYCLMPPLMPLQ
jgi:hypothetical protein